MRPGQSALRAHVYEQTHGDPPNRTCLAGSDDKWNGYLLGIEEALRAIESFPRAEPRSVLRMQAWTNRCCPICGRDPVEHDG